MKLKKFFALALAAATLALALTACGSKADDSADNSDANTDNQSGETVTVTVLLYCSTGISTCCPSATALALTLGPDSPRADQLYPGNLGYSA